MKLTKSKLQEIIKEEIEEELVQQAESIENIQQLSGFVLNAKALYQEEGKTETLKSAVEKALISTAQIYDDYTEEHSQRVYPTGDVPDELHELDGELRDLLNEL
jgi:hypothetical protein